MRKIPDLIGTGTCTVRGDLLPFKTERLGTSLSLLFRNHYEFSLTDHIYKMEAQLSFFCPVFQLKELNHVESYRVNRFTCRDANNNTKVPKLVILLLSVLAAFSATIFLGSQGRIQEFFDRGGPNFTQYVETVLQLC